MVDAPDVEEARTPEQARSRSLTREANALRAEGRWQEALPLSFEAVRADPDNAAAAHNLGVLLSKSGRLAEGEAASRHALSLAPGSPMIVHALAHNLLAQGRYAEGWPLYEARAQMPELNTGFPSDFPFPRWRGEPLAGKRLAIFPEQGLGDQIQFARFLPQLIRDAGAVTLLAMPQLERLFRHNFPGAEIVSASGKVEFPDPDYWTTLHDLPAVLGVEIDAIPCEPYLRPPEAWPALPGDFKIGLKAKGNPRHVNDALRSLSADGAEQLRARLPGTIVSLEPEDSGARNMADTAAIIDQLDLVVSVDTSVAHLAGALGKPCLLLIPGFSPDWRWMFGRTDSPWYPKHRLYRSGTDGDWGPAIDRLIEDVTATRAQSPADRLVAEAIALRAAGQPLRALAATAEAVARDPDSVNAAYTHGIYLSQCGRLADGEAMLRRVHQAAPDLPDPRYALGANLLAQGRYREGWPLYEARTERTGLRDGFPRDFPYPRWKGEDLKGKRIALFPEQGYGDQIQFVRFVSRLVQPGAEVILLTSPPLVRLFEHNFPDVQVLAASGSVDFPDPDYWATLADLPGILGVQLEDLSSSPYLLPVEVQANPGAGFRVGLKLKGSPGHPNDHLRSLSHDLEEYLRSRLPGTLVSLEPEDTDARDFADTAAIIAGLDLVVSVDTSVAHLAGAMGKPCLLLVAGFDPDWRWMFARHDSPWYPGHRLFRGEVDGRWHGAIDGLIAEANARAVARKPTQAPRGSTELAQLMYRAADLRNAKRYPEALDLMRRAVRLAPQNAGALNILGTMLSDIGRLDEAERYQRRALDLAPDYAGFRNGLALNLLAQGRYSEAWPFYEARADVPSITIGFPKGLPAPRWRGEPLAGKRIAIMPEQGFGDQIQFARFVPMLQERGAQIRLFTRPGLVDLFRSSLPGVEVEPAEGAVRLGQPDYWTTLVDMAQPLGVTIETLPPPPYLRTERTWPRLPEGFKIGLRVGGNAAHPNDAWRSLASDDAAALRSRLPGTIIDLDPAQTGARDFADSAALLSQLDLIVSVDTSVAHLAGALDKPCLLLVPGLATDWRWMRDRDDSPWYPRHRLYRSALDGSWQAAIGRLCADANEIATGAVAPEPQPLKLGMWASALALSRKAVAAQPKAADPMRQLGVLLTKLGALEEGESKLRESVALAGAETERPRYELSLNLLAQGRYREAWPFHAARRALTDLNIGYPHGVAGPRWEGQSLTGKRLLILAEQGLGDTLQLARFLPRLIELGAKVTLFERRPLVRLLQSAFPGVVVRDVAEIEKAGEQDYWTTTFDMLEALDVTLGTLAPANYLTVSANARDLASGFAVGLCTRGNPKHSNDQWRSLSSEVTAQLQSRLPGTIIDLSPEKTGARDFAGSAAIMAGLDLVVSVDTSVAHLAGALDKPCLLLLPGFGTDWRWLRGREDSPWYPRHTLFRSEVNGDWSAAIEAVAIRAAELAAGS